MSAHRRDTRAATQAMNEADDNGLPAGELPQYRNRDEVNKPPPAADKSPPMGEGPHTSPDSGMPYQNPGEGPSTDTEDSGVAGNDSQD